MSGSTSLLDRIANPTVANINPLANYKQALDVNNALNQNREFQSRQAAGQAFLGSINPDGTTNQAALNTNLKNDPSTALAAQTAALQGQKLSDDEMQQRYTRLQYGAGVMAPLLAAHPDGNVPYAEIKTAFDQAVKDGHVTAQDEANVMGGFSQGNGTQNYQTILQRLSGNVSMQDNLRNSKPGIGIQNTPQGAVPYQTPPLLAPNGTSAGTITQQPGAIGNDLSPGEQAQLIEVQDPAGPPGQMKKITLGEYLGRGQPTPVQSPFQNGGRNAPPPGSPLLKSNKTPLPAPAPNSTSAARPGLGAAAPAPTTDTGGDIAAPPGTTPPAMAAPGTGGMITKADPNVLERDKSDLAAYQQAKAASQGTVGDKVTLGHALDALKLLEDARLSTGANTDTMHKMYATLQTLGALPKGMQDNVSNWELAKKALTQYAASAGNGAHTDLGLSTAAASNASVDGVTNQTAQTVVKQRLGQINQSLALVNEAPDKQGRGFTDHASQFAQNTDPRAFNFDDYTPAERAGIVKSLGSKDSPAYAKFTRSLQIARRNNMISPPNAGQ